MWGEGKGGGLMGVRTAILSESMWISDIRPWTFWMHSNLLGARIRRLQGDKVDEREEALFSFLNLLLKTREPRSRHGPLARAHRTLPIHIGVYYKHRVVLPCSVQSASRYSISLNDFLRCMHASSLHDNVGNLVSHGVRRAAVYLSMY